MTRTPWFIAGTAALLLATGCSDRDKGQQQGQTTGAGGAQQAQPQAQQPSTPPPAPTAQADVPAGALTINGQVMVSQGGAIKVRSANGESVVLQMNDQTQVYVNGRQGGIGDVTQGKEVRAAFQPPSGAQMPTALRVDVTGESAIPAE